jgi:hypothetical protein
MLSVLAFPWWLQVLEARPEVAEALPLSTEEFLKFQADQQKFDEIPISKSNTQAGELVSVTATLLISDMHVRDFVTPSNDNSAHIHPSSSNPRRFNGRKPNPL